MGRVAILGVFVADTTYRAARQPRLGETILGESFALGPGGKGSNQAVASARAGAETHLVTRIGRDAFGALARETWAEAGVTPAAIEDPEAATGAAYIFVEAATGDNAIIIAPGAAGLLSAADVEAQREIIAGADVFVTQLEQPMAAAMAGFRLARETGVRTVLNPAPAAELPDGMLALADIVTPNESEAEALTGIPVRSREDAARAAATLRGSGSGAAIVTLGKGGCFHDGPDGAFHVPAMRAGPVVETTGAGDAFNGGLAAALSEGRAMREAIAFATATAAISVTRPGTAPSMPTRAEIEALLARG